MRKYWVKIGFGALLIFLVGYSVVSAVRKVKNTIISGHDITIPLGSFIKFNLDGGELGSIRSLTIRRSAPKMVTGFEVRVRLADSLAFAKLENCKVTVNDANRIDERTRFTCLVSDSGFQSFGEVRAELRNDTDDRTLVLPLYLPLSAIQDIQREGGDSATTSIGDSIAREVNSRVRVQARTFADSIAAARLDKRAEDYKRRADSIRNRSATIAVPAPPAGTPAKPVRP
jgi:hypothetical protein